MPHRGALGWRGQQRTVRPGDHRDHASMTASPARRDRPRRSPASFGRERARAMTTCRGPGRRSLVSKYRCRRRGSESNDAAERNCFQRSPGHRPASHRSLLRADDGAAEDSGHALGPFSAGSERSSEADRLGTVCRIGEDVVAFCGSFRIMCACRPHCPRRGVPAHDVRFHVSDDGRDS
jgi:hypothetical protein